MQKAPKIRLGMQEEDYSKVIESSKEYGGKPGAKSLNM